MIFIEYPKCTTCQKAKKWLDQNGFKYEDRHIKEQNPTADEIKEWASLGSIELRRFFNTSGLLYRSMNLKDRLDSLSDSEKLALIATDGMLVKRPILVTDSTVLVGFNEKKWQEALK